MIVGFMHKLLQNILMSKVQYNILKERVLFDKCIVQYAYFSISVLFNTFNKWTVQYAYCSMSVLFNNCFVQ